MREHFSDRLDAPGVPMDELLEGARSGQVVILDTRPASEYVAGHIAGAISVPVDALQKRLKELAKGKEYVAYCRGPYGGYADRAVELLTARGCRARRHMNRRTHGRRRRPSGARRRWIAIFRADLFGVPAAMWLVAAFTCASDVVVAIRMDPVLHPSIA